MQIFALFVRGFSSAFRFFLCGRKIPGKRKQNFLSFRKIEYNKDNGPQICGKMQIFAA